MKIICFTTLLLSAVSFAGQVAVNLGPMPEKDSDWLVYDNGSPAWLTWGGTYRGVWFNMQDFIPGATSATIEQAELWFYHHSEHPWDTSDVYIELWDGDSMGPTGQLDQQMATAIHYAPIYIDYDPAITTADENFWVLANTEMSAGGWPSILGDGMQGSVYHSFYSDDFIVWEPWDIGGACNYFISVYATLNAAFDATTWGALKTTF